MNCAAAPARIDTKMTIIPTGRTADTPPNIPMAWAHQHFDVIHKALWPAAVNVGKGTSIEFGVGTMPVQTAAVIGAVGCHYDSSNFNQYWVPKWDITCSGSEVNIGSLRIHGNIQVKFNVAGSKNTTYNFSGRIQNDQRTKLEFGDGTFNVTEGVIGADLTFDAGAFRAGQIVPKAVWNESKQALCGGNALGSFCSGGELTTDGPNTTFVLDAGFHTGDNAIDVGGGLANHALVLFHMRDGMHTDMMQPFITIIRRFIQKVVIGKTPGHQPATVEVHGPISSILAQMDVLDFMERRFVAEVHADFIEKLEAGEIETKEKQKAPSREQRGLFSNTGCGGLSPRRLVNS